MAKTRKKPPKELNEAQKTFCREYIFDWNGTRAYKVAYPKVNDNVAAVGAYDLLRNPKIADYIEEIQNDLEKVSGISRLKVLNEFAKIAFMSMAGLHNTWIERKEFDELSEEQKACISEIWTKTESRYDKSSETEIQVDYVRVKLYDKQRALESIIKMLGYNPADKIDLTSAGKEITGFKIIMEHGS